MNTNITKGRFRFTESFDSHLISECFGLNPYEDPKRWAVIQVNMIQITGKCLSVRTLRDRMQNLLRKHSAKVQSLQGRSGIEIEVTETDDLLQRICEFIKEISKKKINKSSVLDKTSYQHGYEARELSCSTDKSYIDTIDAEEIKNLDLEEMPQQLENIPEYSTECVIQDIQTSGVAENNIIEVSEPKEDTTQRKNETGRKRTFPQQNISTPNRRKRMTNIRQTTVQYLEQKKQQQFELRRRELELQERKHNLDEKKFEIDHREREKRLEIDERRLQMEEKQFKMQLDLMANQQELMRIVLKK